MTLRSSVALVVDVLLILGSEAGVFIYVLRRSGDETGGIVAVIYTGLFAIVVVPLFELGFKAALGTTPGRMLLGLRHVACPTSSSRHEGRLEVLTRGERTFNTWPHP